MNANNIDLLKSHNGKAVITTKTEVKLLKKDADGNRNELGPIFKVANHTTTVGNTYSQAVNNQRIAEGKQADFVAQQRKWGESDGMFVTKGDQVYLQVVIDESETIKYINQHGVDIDKASFQQFTSKAKRHDPKTQGVEEIVQVRTFNVDNIIDVQLV